MLPLSKQNAYRERYKRLRPGWQPSGEAFEALARAHVSPAARVLDLGCGRGGVMELLWPEAKLAVGLDADYASLAQHRTRGQGGGTQAAPGVRLVCGLGDDLPFPAESFEVVIALWVLEHLARPERALREVRRVLAPNGRFIFLTPNGNHPLILFNRFSWAFPAVQRLLIPQLYGRSETDTFRVRYRANTIGQLRTLAAASGFQVTSLRAISDPTYLAFNGLFFQLSILFEDLLPANLGVHLIGDFARR